MGLKGVDSWNWSTWRRGRFWKVLVSTEKGKKDSGIEGEICSKTGLEKNKKKDAT